MAATFRKTRLRRLGNVVVTPLARLGLAGKRTHILTVPGRKSGRRYSTSRHPAFRLVAFAS